MSIGFEIHPTIGILRVGASEGFFIGPEPDHPPPKFYRDADGILRQAARFRIFRVDRDDAGMIRAAEEITADDADIEWTVHLANRKATAHKVTRPTERRNRASGKDDLDKDLIIDPGARSISFASPTAAFDGGKFRGTPVDLGEIRIEASTGRLIVIGGRGQSGFVPPLAPGDSPATTPKEFADNDGWFDDTCEGPVTAKVRLKKTGEEPSVTGARVIAGPPDFAPDIQNFVTLYDIVYQVAIEKGLFPRPETWSFMRFVHPVLLRASNYQWVNAAASQGHGRGAFRDFEALMENLADPESSAVMRPGVFSRLRNPSLPGGSASAMPRLFSEDGYQEKKFRALALTPIQFEAMSKWAQVPTPPEFVWDFPADPRKDERLPDALDRVALEACSGGAFFPGIEAPRFVRDAKNFEPTLPVRLREDLPAGIVNAESAVPWQADFYDCTWEGTRDEAGIESFETRSDYGWWPAQRPDSVFVDANLETREPWARGIESKRDMVDRWHTRRFVLKSKDSSGRAIYTREPLIET